MQVVGQQEPSEENDDEYLISITTSVLVELIIQNLKMANEFAEKCRLLSEQIGIMPLPCFKVLVVKYICDAVNEENSPDDQARE